MTDEKKGAAKGANGDGPAKKAKKAPALYNLFSEGDGGTLNPIGQFEGRNAEEAVGVYLERENTDGEGTTFVIVPQRNLSRVTPEVEVKRRVKLRAV